MLMQLSRCIRRYFTSIDMFPQRVQLLIKQDESHKSIIGATLSTLVITIMTVLLYYSMVDLLSHGNPQTMTTDAFHPNPDQFKLDSSNFTIAVALHSSDYFTYIDESIFIVEATLKQKTVIVNSNGTAQDVWDVKPIELVPCSYEMIKQESVKDYFSRLNLPTFYCIDWSKHEFLTLEGTFEQNLYRFINFSFKVCNEKNKRSISINKLENGPPCKDHETIQKYMLSNYFSVAISSNNLDLKNLDKPHHQRGDKIFTTISSGIAKEINMYMRPMTTNTDIGLISTEIITQKSLKYGRYIEMIDMNESDQFLKFIIRLDTTEELSYRSYTKLQTIAGQLGGLWNKPLSNLSYRLSIINSLFTFQVQDEVMKDSFVAVSDRQLASSRINNKQPFSSRRELGAAQKKLHSIMQQSQQLEEPQIDKIRRFKMSKILSQSIKNYFKIASKPAQLSIKEYCQYFISCFRYKYDQIKSSQIEFATQKLRKQLDILHIIKKVQEIDKLKMLFLTKEQLQLFDYLPKPCIPLDQTTIQYNYNQYFSILNPAKSSHQRAKDAQEALKVITQTPTDVINQRLLNCIDRQTLELLQLRMQESEEQLSPQEGSLYSSINFEAPNKIELPNSYRCKSAQSPHQSQYK